jgi:hypothetical protein
MDTRYTDRVRILLILILFVVGCGPAQPRAEATWETHTVAPDDDDQQSR